MKIIIAESAQSYNKSGGGALDIMEACPRIWMKADSALLTHGKPMFAPDFTQELSAAPYLALRISRMGKSIPARFAHRYYDAVGVAVDFTAEDVLRRLRAEGEPWDMAKSFDGSVCVGEFHELGCGEASKEFRLTLLVDGEAKSETRIDNLAQEAGEVIERVSRFFTLRQGDLLLMGKPSKRPLVQVDSHIVGQLNGEVLTEFNIK